MPSWTWWLNHTITVPSKPTRFVRCPYQSLHLIILTKCRDEEDRSFSGSAFLEMIWFLSIFQQWKVRNQILKESESKDNFYCTKLFTHFGEYTAVPVPVNCRLVYSHFDHCPFGLVPYGLIPFCLQPVRLITFWSKCHFAYWPFCLILTLSNAHFV